MTSKLLYCLALLFCLAFPTKAQEKPTRTPQIPALDWKQRSDWNNVLDSGAKGDGKSDDTAAVQAFLKKIKSGGVAYFPAGTYRITKTIRIDGPMTGVTFIGHGRDTTLLWDGPEGGVLFLDDGLSLSQYIGLQFEGQGKASIGFHHYSDKRFETEVRHQHLAFRNFTKAGIYLESNDKYALAETLFENCLFENCAIGVSSTSFNDYNLTYEGCEFVRCGTGVLSVHGNFYVRNCHFRESTTVDIQSNPEHAVSVRRCTSVGSRAFIRHSSSVSPITIQNCRVTGWTGYDVAISLNGAPVMVFDCVFEKGTGNEAIRSGGGQPVLASENRVVEGGAVFANTRNIITIPAGKRKATPLSTGQTFLKDTAFVPGKVYDVKKDFGAKGDGKTDDTKAIEKAIKKARKRGHNAIAYFPEGVYAVSKTITLSGSDYVVGGCGYQSRLCWIGKKGGTILAVKNPRNLRLEYLSVGVHNAGKATNVIDILQTGSSRGSSMTYESVYTYGMYQREPLRQGLHLRGLTAKDRVRINCIQGNLRVIDSAAAEILANCSYEGSVVVEGKKKDRSGFLGFMTRLSTITTHGLYLRDNQNIVMSDFYIEQSDDGYVLEGSAELPAGRATIQGGKVDFSSERNKEENRVGTMMTINNYHGSVFFGPNQFYASLASVPVKHEGDAVVDLYLLGNAFYKTYLDVTKGAGLKLHLAGNRGHRMNAKKQDLNAINKASDNVTEEDLKAIATGLDDLRRLGELDLLRNHGVSLPKQDKAEK